MNDTYPISEYFNRILTFPDAALSASGMKLAYVCSLTGSPQIWIGEVPEAGLLRYPKPLTAHRGKQPHIHATCLQWLSDRKLVCLFDTDGDETTFIEVLDLSSGMTQPVPRGPAGTRDNLGFVTAGPGSKAMIYFTSNRVNPKCQGLFSFQPSTGEVTLLFQDSAHSAFWYPELRHDGYLLFGLAISNTSQKLMGVHPKTGAVTTLFDKPDTHIVAVRPLRELGGRSSDKILVDTNYEREFQGPALLDPKSGALTPLNVAGKALRGEWDRESHLGRSGKHLLIHENRAGKSVVSIFQWPSLKKSRLRLPDQGVIDHLSCTPDGRYALMAYSSPSEPRDFYRVDLATRTTQRLTDNYLSKVPRARLVHPKLIKYPSKERQIFSWFFLPQGARRESSLPVIVWPHGGPQWQEKPQQRPVFQYFLSRGFAVWAPNHSGSTGFGKSCAMAIERAWGTADLPDMENGIRWLQESGWIDPNRMAIMGGSYGGYMTLRSITRFPDVFKAAVDIFGVTNLITFCESVPEDWKPYMDRMVGDPERDRKMLLEQSPIMEIDRIRCPLLVIQGAKDPRVVKAESDQLVKALESRGQPVEYLVFEDEGHGFLKLENELAAYTRAADFVQEHLGANARSLHSEGSKRENAL